MNDGRSETDTYTEASAYASPSATGRRHMSGGGDDHRPIDALSDQLDRIEAKAVAIEAKADRAATQSDKAYREAKATNGRLRKVEDTLYGPDEERRRASEPGALAKLAETRALAQDLATARDESKAVKEMKRWMIGIGVTTVSTMLLAVGLLVQLVQAS